MKKREPFECPHDLKSCSQVDTATGYLRIECKNCPRFNKKRIKNETD